MAERLLVGVIVILSLVTATILTLVVRNEVAGPRIRVEPLRSQTLTPNQWRRLTAGARLVADASATSPGKPVTILAFSDFQCPACRQFAAAIGASNRSHPGRISLVYRDYPLVAIHPQALTAARAGVCASSAHAFTSFYKAVFNAQDSLGRVHWAILARLAGVSDTVRFASCIADSTSQREVADDKALGDSIGVFATPTVIIDGRRLSRPPTPVELDSIIAAAR